MPATARRHHHPYGAAHRRSRAALLPQAIGTPCPAHYSPHCTGLMTNPRLMHLDHTVPLALGGQHGDRIICAPCNLSAGATLGNRLRAQTNRIRPW